MLPNIGSGFYVSVEGQWSVMYQIAGHTVLIMAS